MSLPIGILALLLVTVTGPVPSPIEEVTKLPEFE